MTKKYKLKMEIEESVARKLTSNDCPNCGMHFFSPMNKDAHKQRYPGHFSSDNVKLIRSSTNSEQKKEV